MSNISIIIKRALVVCVRRARSSTIVLLLACAAAFAQQPAPANNSAQRPEAKPADSKSATKPAYTLTVRQKPILNISLKAEKAKLSEIRDELSRKLKVPVFLGPAMENELVSTEFSELTLEPAMQLLAPAVYIDYQILTGSAQSRPLGIYFYGANQAEPPLTAVIQNVTQSLLIEGDTEEGTEPQTDEQRKKEEEQPLKVTFQNNTLTLKSKKQPLALVLLKIGEQLGIPVDIQYQPPEIIDLELNKMPVEDAIRRLSPSIQMFVRADLTRAERRVLRLAVTMPTTTMGNALP